MNNKLICPFCQQELVKDTPFAWNCPNEECVETDMMWGTANMWQELIRTRKALKIAVDALKEIDKTRCGVDVKLYAVNHKSLNAGNVFCWTTIDEIHNALEQITALEQKE